MLQGNYVSFTPPPEKPGRDYSRLGVALKREGLPQRHVPAQRQDQFATRGHIAWRSLRLIQKDAAKRELVR